MANRLYAFISNSRGVLYDAREVDTINITSNLYIINKINTINTNALQINGVVLQVYDYTFLCQFEDILEFSDTFILYLTNVCLSISPSDKIKISSWLNNQWNIIVKSK